MTEIAKDHAKYVAAKWLTANQLRSAVFEIVLIVIGVIVMVVSIFLQSVMPEQNWFMRSGAIVVLVGAIMEYRHTKLTHSIDMESIKWASGVGGPVVFQPSRLRKFLGYLAHVYVITGTFLAAYGDLVFVMAKEGWGL